MPSLTNFLSSLRSHGFDPSTHISATRTMVTFFSYYLGTLGHIKKKKSIPRGSGFFLHPTLPPRTSFCVGRYCGCDCSYLTENFSRGVAGWLIPCVTMYLRSLKYLFFSFPTATHFSERIFPCGGWVGGPCCPDPLFSVCLHSYSVFCWQGNVFRVFLFSS